ncbi:MAG: D-tyrosyl-tRNA(Tyr) deacylase [Clostridiales bacterium]|jgi:D-tyrosyl-tRNA(Tyr) deacylase|nr:D-tyrosyl-tRNA(Tyr) deacylase [Clostridiales bacterium]
MVAVITRVKSASVKVDGYYSAQIETGLLVLLGVAEDDTDTDAEYLANKITGLRIFEDESGKMNLSVDDVAGSIVVVPNFTLNAECRKGRRPDFNRAAKPERAEVLYEKFVEYCKSTDRDVQTGVFGGYMAVESHNDGPVTIIMDTETMMRGRDRR